MEKVVKFSICDEIAGFVLVRCGASRIGSSELENNNLILDCFVTGQSSVCFGEGTE